MSPQPRLLWPLPTALGLSLAAIWHRLLDLRYGSAMFIFHRLYLKTIFPFCILMIPTNDREPIYIGTDEESWFPQSDILPGASLSQVT